MFIHIAHTLTPHLIHVDTCILHITYVHTWIGCICIYELCVGDTYYWNRTTNETSWTFPNASECVRVCVYVELSDRVDECNIAACICVNSWLSACLYLCVYVCMCAWLYGVLIWQRWRRSARSLLHVRKLRKKRKLQVMQTFRYLCLSVTIYHHYCYEKDKVHIYLCIFCTLIIFFFNAPVRHFLPK